MTGKEREKRFECNKVRVKERQSSKEFNAGTALLRRHTSQREHRKS